MSSGQGGRRGLVTATLAAVIAVAAVGASAEARPDRSGAQPRGFTLKIGNTVPLTGDNAVYGPSFAKAAEIAVGQATGALRRAGVRDTRISVETVDDGTRTDTAVSAARKLIGEGATCLVGSIPSANTRAIAQAASVPAGVTLVATASSSVIITDLEDNGLVFRVFPSDALQAPVLANIIRQQIGRGRLVSLAARNDVFGVGLMNRLRPSLQREGMRTKGPVLFDPGAATYNSEADEIVAGNPDAFVVVEFPAGYAKIGGALIRTGRFDAKRLFLAGGQPARIPEFVPFESMEGARGTRAAVPLGAGAAERYDRIFKQQAGSVQRQGVDAFNFDATMLCILGAIAADSSDGRRIARQLRRVSGPPGTKYNFLQLPQAIRDLRAGKDIDYEGVSGSIDLDANGDPAGATYDYYRFIGGNLTVERQYRLLGGRVRVLDLTPPTTPVVRGPRIVRSGTVVYSRRSTEPGNVSPPVSFVCGLDTFRLRKCSQTLRLRLTPGRHVLRVRASDAQGNRSAMATVRIRAR